MSMNFFTINFLRKVDVNSLIYENMSEDVKELLNQFFRDDESDKKLADGERIEIFNQVSAAKHEQLFKPFPSFFVCAAWPKFHFLKNILSPFSVPHFFFLCWLNAKMLYDSMPSRY